MAFPSMCNLYSSTKRPKSIRDIVHAMGGDWRDSVGNLQPQPAIFPDAMIEQLIATLAKSATRH
jgi:hypothetical protein